MSVIVRGMEMPKVCGDCPFTVWYSDGFYCAAQISNREKYDYSQAEFKPKECPLFEVKDWKDL